MAELFGLMQSPIPTISVSANVLKKDEYMSLLDAQALLKLASEKADELLADAEKEAEQILLQAREKAEVAADEIIAKHRVAAQISAREKLQEVESEVVSLVKLTIERLFGDIGRDEAIAAMIRSGIEGLRDNYRVTIRVAPDHLATLEAALPALCEKLSSIDHLEISPDHTMAADSYALEGDNSVIKGSLADQFAKLDDVISLVLIAD